MHGAITPGEQGRPKYCVEQNCGLKRRNLISSVWTKAGGFLSTVRNFTPTVFRNSPAEATGQKWHLKRNELLPVSGDAESHLLFDWNFNGWLSGSEEWTADNK